MDQSERDLYAQEAASVMSSLDNRLSSLSQSASINAVVAAGGLTVGLSGHPEILCLLPFLLSISLSYTLMVSGDSAGLAGYRLFLEDQLAELEPGKPRVLRFEKSVNSLRSDTNPGYKAQVSAIILAYGIVVVAAILAGLSIHHDKHTWLWLYAAIAACVVSAGLLLIGAYNTVNSRDEAVKNIKLHLKEESGKEESGK